MHRIAILLLSYILLYGCATPPPLPYPAFPASASAPNTTIFNQAALVGSGVLPATTGPQLFNCITRATQNYQGSTLTTNIELLTETDILTERSDYEAATAFVNYAATQLQNATLTVEKPVTFLITLRLLQRQAQIDDTSVKLSRTALQLVRENKQSEFFAHCGTGYIDSIRYTTTAYLLLRYYPINQQQHDLLRRYQCGNMDNIWRFRQLNQQLQAIPVAVAIEYDGDQNITPYQLLDTRADNGVNMLLQQLAEAVYRSGSGKITSYTKRFWSQALIANNLRFRNYETGSTVLFSPESTFTSLYLLQRQAYESQHRRIIAAEINHLECLENTEPLITDLRQCTQDAEKQNIANLALIPSCQLLQNKIDQIHRACPSELNHTVESMVLPLVEKQITNYVPGMNFAIENQPAEKSCITKKNYDQLHNQQNSVSHFILYPLQNDKPDIPNYIGGFRQIGFTPALTAESTVAPELEELYFADSAAFQQRCGSHYIDQIKQHRGFMFHWQPQARQDLQVDFFGINPDLITAADLQIDSLQKFKTIQPNIRNLLENNFDGTPVELHLISWRQFFKPKLEVDQFSDFDLNNSEIMQQIDNIIEDNSN